MSDPHWDFRILLGSGRQKTNPAWCTSPWLKNRRFSNLLWLQQSPRELHFCLHTVKTWNKKENTLRAIKFTRNNSLLLKPWEAAPLAVQDTQSQQGSYPYWFLSLINKGQSSSPLSKATIQETQSVQGQCQFNSWTG